MKNVIYARRENNFPLVSVILTSHNGEKYLREQLDSVVFQTYKNIEIIITDDASCDRTLEVLSNYAEHDSRVMLIRHEKNIGLHANIAGALEQATGEYIAISDQDDIWRLDKIEKQLSLLNGAVGVYSDSALIDAVGNSLGLTLFQSLRIKADSTITRTVPLFFKNAVSGHTLLFHRSLLSMVLPFTDDFIFDHQLALAASCYGGLNFYPEPLVYHRIHGDNHTNAGLAGKQESKKTAENRMEKRRLNRWRLQQRIQYVVDRVPWASEILSAHGILCSTELMQDIARIPAEMACYDRVFFNLCLFNLLRKLGNKHRYCRKLRLTNCFTLAKGARWDKLAERLSSR